jgi:uncharacterized protein YlxP (DUF503 family)
MIKHSENSIRQSRIAALEAELTARDCRVLKAARAQLKDVIEQMYPGETEWYNSMIEKINQLKGEG